MDGHDYGIARLECVFIEAIGKLGFH